MQCRYGTAEHGTRRMYRQVGCRCDECRAAMVKSVREYAAAYKAKHGHGLWGNYRNGTESSAHGNFVPRKVRHAIYERDQWTCQLCAEPVDPELDPCHRMAATLDHIEPQSVVLIPDHSPSNLRLAHRACNSRRNNRAA